MNPSGKGAYGTKERTFLHVIEGKKGEKFEKNYKVNVYDGDDELQAGIAEWIHDNTRMPMPRVLMNGSPFSRDGCGAVRQMSRAPRFVSWCSIVNIP